MILNIAISGYRSIRDLVVPLDRLTVITGANGTGKSSLYRAVRLLAEVAQGRAIGALAREGGLQSTLWAGPETISRTMKDGSVPVQGTRRSGPVALRLGLADEDYGYAIDLGLPVPEDGTIFGFDPVIKAEALWAGESLSRRNVLATRNAGAVQVLQEDGTRRMITTSLAPFDSMMTHTADAKNAPELLTMRERMRAWRFYDHFRTDSDAPARRAQIGTRTTALASDGADLAAAFRTIEEIGDRRGLHAAIADAFPGSEVGLDVQDGRFELTMRQSGLLRPLRTAELSDGTLRYLLLVVALFTPRPPPLIVLNEPETSLHPSLLDPLARLVSNASKYSQILVVTHAAGLVKALAGAPGSISHELEKQLGETVIEDCDYVSWNWPSR